MIKNFAIGELAMQTRTINSICGTVLCLMGVGIAGCPLLMPDLLGELLAPPQPSPKAALPACQDIGRTFTAEGFASVTVICGGVFRIDPRKLNDGSEVIGDLHVDRSGFLIADSMVFNLGDLYPSGINDAGQIAGSFTVPQRVAPALTTSHFDRPAVYEDGEQTQLPAFPGGEIGRALAINNAGTLVGWAVNGPPVFALPFPSQGRHIPAMWHRVEGQWQITTLDGLPDDPYSWADAIALNEREQVLVRGLDGQSTGSFLWETGVLTELPTLGGAWTEARDINDDGQVVGQTSNGQFVVEPTADLGPEYRLPVRRAFLWQDGVISDLGTLGGQSSQAIAINNLGQVIGQADTPEFGFFSEFASYAIARPFLWQEGVMVDLNDLVPPDAGVTITVVVDINDVGQILAWARFVETDESAIVLVDLPD